MKPLAPRPPAPAGPSAAHGWQWYAGRAFVVLFTAALLGLLWLLHRQELEEKRGAVIRDILWIEQNLRFALDRDVEQLSDVGGDVGAE